MPWHWEYCRMLPIKEFELYVAKTGPLSVVHGLGHLRRTAVGASWFCIQSGGSITQQQTAYVAGLLHDLKRPATEKIDHTEISVREAENVLDKFNISGSLRNDILNLIAEHRESRQNNSLTEWVYLADKILEQAGAYLVFRRAYYVGECDDFKNQEPRDAAIGYWHHRKRKFNPEVFPERYRKLCDYQFKWSFDYLVALEARANWATELNRTFVRYGREKRPGLEELISNYQAVDKNVQILKTEAQDYLNQRKFTEFAKLLG